MGSSFNIVDYKSPFFYYKSSFFYLAHNNTLRGTHIITNVPRIGRYNTCIYYTYQTIWTVCVIEYGSALGYNLIIIWMVQNTSLYLIWVCILMYNACICLSIIFVVNFRFLILADTNLTCILVSICNILIFAFFSDIDCHECEIFIYSISIFSLYLLHVYVSVMYAHSGFIANAGFKWVLNIRICL